MAQSSNEVTLNSSYYSDNASSLDNDTMQIEYDSLCEISLKIINKNTILKTKRDLLEKEILELNEKIKKLKRSKEIDIAYKSCQEIKFENARLKETQVKFVKFDESANSLREMLNNQKSSSCKIGLGFDSSKASTSGTKLMSFVGSSAEKATDRSTIKVHGSTLPGPVCLRTCLEPDEWIKDSGFSKHMTGNKSLFSTYKSYDGGNVVFESNLKGKIIGKGSSIIAIRTDHGREFDNEVQFEAYCDAQGITHNFSAPRTPQSNGVVERKNMTLQEMSRTMLNEQSIPQKFWCNAVDTPPPTKLSPLVDDDVSEEEAIRKNTKVVNNNNEEDESIEVAEIINIKESKNHPLDQVIGNLNQRTLRSQAQNHSNFFCFISTIEPKDVNEALKDECWVLAMQEELN
ncbi:zf-CCHC domain-containing protein [Tanacetum coccineum]